MLVEALEQKQLWASPFSKVFQVIIQFYVYLTFSRRVTHFCNLLKPSLDFWGGFFNTFRKSLRNVCSLVSWWIGTRDYIKQYITYWVFDSTGLIDLSNVHPLQCSSRFYLHTDTTMHVVLNKYSIMTNSGVSVSIFKNFCVKRILSIQQWTFRLLLTFLNFKMNHKHIYISQTIPVRVISKKSAI